jgi:peptidoglycan/xylan/chitin deacetylase (PgdA/CDA1 family)
VVITIDDLPKTMGSDSLESATLVTEQIIAALARHQVPALGFVIGDKVFMNNQVDARLDLLRRWLGAGSDLANHSFTHPSFNTTDLVAYQDDVIHGDLVPRLLMGEKDRTLRYFRHPYNQTGPTAEIQSDFRAFMAARETIIAPFTVEHSDYMFNSLWAEAKGSGDEEGAERIRKVYMEYLDTAFDFAEELTLDTFGDPIPQVFLIHANDLNGVCLDAMLARLQERGYRFVSLDQALEHPSYATPDDYVGTNGISWLHRWRHSLGLPDRLRDEPDPPAWILKAWLKSQE